VGTLDRLGDLHAWLGLKNSDDIGTQFDLRAEFYKNATIVASGETLCITGVTREPTKAKEAIIGFPPVSGITLAQGDLLSVKILTRIGTVTAGAACKGPGGSHASAVGLLLYYDAATKASRLGAQVYPFTLPPDPGAAGKQTLEGVDSDRDGVRDDVQRYIALSYPTDPALRAALRQLAKENQGFITQAESDRSVIYSINERRFAAQDCLYYVNGGDIYAASRARLALRAVQLDTPERSRAFLKSDAKLSGLIFKGSDPAGWSASCR
jgi:hypothetical protein